MNQKKSEKIASDEDTLFLVNPFVKIAGVKALLAGMLVMLLMSWIGVTAKVYFMGVMGVLNSSVLAKEGLSDITFGLLLSQNLISWFVLALTFILVTAIFQRQNTRVMDFLGAVALARFPLLIMTIVLALIQMFHPSFLVVDMTHGMPVKNTWGVTLFGVFAFLIFIWEAAIYFYAFKVSSSLTGKKLGFCFILALIVAETVSHVFDAWVML